MNMEASDDDNGDAPYDEIYDDFTTEALGTIPATASPPDGEGIVLGIDFGSSAIRAKWRRSGTENCMPVTNWTFADDTDGPTGPGTGTEGFSSYPTLIRFGPELGKVSIGVNSDRCGYTGLKSAFDDRLKDTEECKSLLEKCKEHNTSIEQIMARFIKETRNAFEKTLAEMHPDSWKLVEVRFTVPIMWLHKNDQCVEIQAKYYELARHAGWAEDIVKLESEPDAALQAWLSQPETREYIRTLPEDVIKFSVLDLGDLTYDMTVFIHHRQTRNIAMVDKPQGGVAGMSSLWKDLKAKVDNDPAKVNMCKKHIFAMEEPCEIRWYEDVIYSPDELETLFDVALKPVEEDLASLIQAPNLKFCIITGAASRNLYIQKRLKKIAATLSVELIFLGNTARKDLEYLVANGVTMQEPELDPYATLRDSSIGLIISKAEGEHKDLYLSLKNKDKGFAHFESNFESISVPPRCDKVEIFLGYDSMSAEKLLGTSADTQRPVYLTKNVTYMDPFSFGIRKTGNSESEALVRLSPAGQSQRLYIEFIHHSTYQRLCVKIDRERWRVLLTEDPTYQLSPLPMEAMFTNIAVCLDRCRTKQIWSRNNINQRSWFIAEFTRVNSQSSIQILCQPPIVDREENQGAQDNDPKDGWERHGYYVCCELSLHVNDNKPKGKGLVFALPRQDRHFDLAVIWNGLLCIYKLRWKSCDGTTLRATVVSSEQHRGRMKSHPNVGRTSIEKLQQAPRKSMRQQDMDYLRGTLKSMYVEAQTARS